MSLYAATATSVFYTLSLHDALPILLAVTSVRCRLDFHVADQIRPQGRCSPCLRVRRLDQRQQGVRPRSEEHTSELQSPYELVCRLLLEKKNAAAEPRVSRHPERLYL